MLEHWAFLDSPVLFTPSNYEPSGREVTGYCQLYCQRRGGGWKWGASNREKTASY
jgi:hypothetical protein